MKIDNADFGWQDPDLVSCNPHFTFPGEVQDEDMRRDSFPQFSDEAKWMLALRDLKLASEKSSRKR